MKFRVIDKRTGDDITKDYPWLMKPDGTLYYYDYDLIGLSYAEAVPVKEESK